jgi:predicted TIM-barrel fold metal-dependent hydrolase
VDDKTLDSIPVVSADCHVAEPVEELTARVPTALRDKAPRIEERDGVRRVVFPTLDDPSLVDLEGPNWEPADEDDFSAEELKRLKRRKMMAETNPRTHDLEARLEDADLDGIAVQVVHPNLGINFGLLERDIGAALCHAYNEWLIDALAHPRIVTPVLIPMWDVDEAIAELHYGVERGVRVANIPVVPPGKPYNSATYEPLWEAASATDVNFVMHQGTGHDMVRYRGKGSGPVNLGRSNTIVARTIGLLACSGVMERHPDVHFVGVECEGGWFAWLMQILDAGYVKLFEYPKLGERPSAYLRRQAHVTFQDDPVAVHNVALTGPEVLLWGNDYPHMEGTFPESREAIRRLFADTPIDWTRKILGETAATVFHVEDVVAAWTPRASTG